MNVSMSALRKPLALAAVTAVMFSAVACSGADPTSAPPPASNTSASEPAAEPTPTTSAASPTASPSATPSAKSTTNAQGNDALLAAGGLGSKEVSKGTVVSIESERNGWEVHVNWVDYPPGRVGTRHKHPGFTLAYVLEGAVITKITGQAEQTYKTGQMFYEPPGAIHEVSTNASQTDRARLLAMNFIPKGQPLTSPA